MIVKICGLQTPEAILAADAANYTGFVMGSPRSSRNISEGDFNKLRKLVHHSKTVIVTATAERETLIQIDSLNADVIQLHGESRKYKHLLSTPYAIACTNNSFINDQSAEYIVLDSVRNDGYGGSGIVWNWKDFPEIQESDPPILVAGGVSLDNVDEVMAVTQASGVDLSSSLEIGGVKSPILIKKLLQKVEKYGKQK